MNEIQWPSHIPQQDHYDLCWDCMMNDHDFFMMLWRKDIAGHTAGTNGKCNVCGKESEK